MKVVVCQRESEMFSKLRLEMNFVKIQGNNWTILVKYNVHIFKTEGKEQRETNIEKRQWCSHGRACFNLWIISFTFSNKRPKEMSMFRFAIKIYLVRYSLRLKIYIWQQNLKRTDSRFVKISCFADNRTLSWVPLSCEFQCCNTAIWRHHHHHRHYNHIHEHDFNHNHHHHRQGVFWCVAPVLIL